MELNLYEVYVDFRDISIIAAESELVATRIFRRDNPEITDEMIEIDGLFVYEYPIAKGTILRILK